ncbi:hypothetical protein PVK06_008220 [Gossypium arboreum]|uniref:Uncharacterized protein n=1 Tax=Gossypium arboreum TaxID=29729 RepID=A0ABR0QKE9_GOSAR|nr:hypothetical protein PVK06_008220 [Gossypium arboreum]
MQCKKGTYVENIPSATRHADLKRVRVGSSGCTEHALARVQGCAGAGVAAGRYGVYGAGGLAVAQRREP